MSGRVLKALAILVAVGFVIGTALPVTVFGQAPTPPPAPAAPKKEAVKKGDPQVMRIQQALKKAGFDPGPIDGILGRKTRAAVRSFQGKNKLKADGRVGKETLAKLQPFMETQ